MITEDRKFTKGGDGESSQQGGSSIASGLRGKVCRSLTFLIVVYFFSKRQRISNFLFVSKEEFFDWITDKVKFPDGYASNLGNCVDRSEGNCVCEYGYFSGFRYSNCFCNGGYEGNPYLPGGCININECDGELGQSCLGQTCECPWIV
ncbi:unnamed protein product [Brassica oleracea]